MAIGPPAHLRLRAQFSRRTRYPSYNRFSSSSAGRRARGGVARLPNAISQRHQGSATVQDHTEYATAIGWLARKCTAITRPRRDDARLLETCARHRGKGAGSRLTLRWTPLYGLGLLFTSQKRYAEALPLYKRSWLYPRENPGPDLWRPLRPQQSSRPVSGTRPLCRGRATL